MDYFHGFFSLRMNKNELEPAQPSRERLLGTFSRLLPFDTISLGIC